MAGILKATVGAHEVITTIMLNWTAIFVGVYLIQGPLFDPVAKKVGAPPITKPIAESAKLPVIWVRPSCRVSTSACSSPSQRSSSTGSSSTGRRSGTRCERWGSTPTRLPTGA